MTLTRRSALLAGTAAALGLGLGTGPAAAAGAVPGPRRAPHTLLVAADGSGDFTSVQDAVSATPDHPAEPWTIVLAPGVYRETVLVTAAKSGLSLVGATGDPRDAVIVFGNAAGTQKPDGSGTFGTTGSATTTVQAAGFTARDITFANDWLRADHPGITGTQAVAIKVQGDRSAFFRCRFLAHQDTLYTDSLAVGAFARMYFLDCYAEGDVDFVFGRATAVHERCHFHTLTRTDLAGPPYGFVFAPSTAAADPRGFLVLRSRITSGAPDGFYKLARPWVPSSDTTAVPMLTVRDSWLGSGIDAVAPYTNMSDAFPWQNQRFAEYHNSGPGAVITVPENRPQLTDEQADAATRALYLGDWTPTFPATPA